MSCQFETNGEIGRSLSTAKYEQCHDACDQGGDDDDLGGPKPHVGAHPEACSHKPGWSKRWRKDAASAIIKLTTCSDHSNVLSQSPDLIWIIRPSVL
jgi:hypothetical protein